MNQHWCWHESSCYCNLLKTQHVSSQSLHESNMNKIANTKKNNLICFMYYMHFGLMQTTQVWVIDIPLNTVTHHLHSFVFQTVRITLQSGKSTIVILRSLCLIDASVRTDSWTGRSPNERANAVYTQGNLCYLVRWKTWQGWLTSASSTFEFWVPALLRKETQCWLFITVGWHFPWVSNAGNSCCLWGIMAQQKTTHSSSMGECVNGEGGGGRFSPTILLLSDINATGNLQKPFCN